MLELPFNNAGYAVIARNATWNSDEHSFNDSLKASSGLEPQKRNYPPLQSSAGIMRSFKFGID